MYIITYLKDLMYFILNKKIGQNETENFHSLKLKV